MEYEDPGDQKARLIVLSGKQIGGFSEGDSFSPSVVRVFRSTRSIKSERGSKTPDEGTWAQLPKKKE